MLLDAFLVINTIVPIAIVIHLIFPGKSTDDWLIAFAASCLLLKDQFSDRSIAQRVFGIQIKSAKSNSELRLAQKIARNGTFLIYPLEALVALLNPERRIGDFIAGSKVGDASPQQLREALSEVKSGMTSPKFALLIVTTALIRLLFLI